MSVDEYIISLQNTIKPVKNMSFIKKIKQLLRIKDYIEVSAHENMAQNGEDVNLNPITEDEKIVLGNIIGSISLTASDMMSPRSDIIALDIDDDINTVLDTFKKNRCDCIPLYRENIDNIIGLLYLSDLISALHKEYTTNTAEGSTKTSKKLLGNIKIENLAREVLFVPPSIRVLELLIKMRISEAKLALVVDEFGGIDGIVSLEDIIEEIVGKIENPNNDENIPQITKLDDGSYIADGRILLEDLYNTLEMSFEENEDVDTLSGLLCDFVGRVPSYGELIKLPIGLECKIKEADPRRVKKVILRKVAIEEES